MNKKLKNEMRTGILKSLESHRDITGSLIQNEFLLDSAKNLGKKRKKSLNESNSKEKQMEDSMQDESFEEDDSVTSEEEPENLANKSLPKVPLTLDKENINLSENYLEEFFETKRLSRLNQGLLLDDDFEEVSLNLELPIPDKKNVKLINRNNEINEERIALPIIKFESEIMDKINTDIKFMK
jgi:hypothetical protein